MVFIFAPPSALFMLPVIRAEGQCGIRGIAHQARQHRKKSPPYLAGRRGWCQPPGQVPLSSPLVRTALISSDYRRGYHPRRQPVTSRLATVEQIPSTHEQASAYAPSGKLAGCARRQNFRRHRHHQPDDRTREERSSAVITNIQRPKKRPDCAPWRRKASCRCLRRYPATRATGMSVSRRCVTEMFWRSPGRRDIDTYPRRRHHG